MKKNKKNLKKLTLNKNVVSKLEESQVNGGIVVTVFCVTQLNCPTILNCPTLNPNCLKTLNPRDCLIRTIDCSFVGCITNFVC
jgi:hypothetical protein